MLKFGYGGRVLRIDLSERRFEINHLEKSWIKNVVGGRAANSKRLLEELAPDCDPLGPDNLLIFGVGPLTGTNLPASAYFTVSSKSPLTGILGDSAAGGHFAAEMKSTGFDQIIIHGSSDNLLYLLIREDGVKFIDCQHLAGKNILQTTAIIREENKNYSLQVAAIGPAGENKVLFSSIVSSGNRVNGRTGMGAVMGAKNIKAVVVTGDQPVDIHDPLAYNKMVDEIAGNICRHEEFHKRHQLGTTMLMNDLNGIGILPTNHFLKGTCDYISHISGEQLADLYKVKNKSCFNCNLHCSRYYICGDIEAEGPEFETLCGFTSRIGCSDLAFALEMNYTLNQMGLDSLAVCEIVGWLMECQQKGLIAAQDLGGISLKWGDTNAVRKLVHMIVYREGVGEDLASGATRFSKNFGEEAQKLVMQVKGLDLICGDPRGIKAYGLTYAIASRGADHLRAEPYFELSNRFDVARARFGTEKAADRLSEEGKAALVTYSERIALLTDCLTICKNIGLCMDVINLENGARLLSAGTGLDYSPEYLDTIMADAIQRDYQLNKKFGLKKEDDTLPERFTKEPLLDGPTKGSVVNIKKMVSEYYHLHSWE